MAQEIKSIDIGDNPDLLRIVEEVRTSNEPRALRHDNQVVAILRPARRPRKPRAPAGRPTSSSDPLWKLIGIGASEGPGDVSTDKHRYLADAYGDRHA